MVNSSFVWTLFSIVGTIVLVTLIRSFSFALGNLRTSAGVFARLQRAISFAEMAFFHTHEAGQILNRVSSDTYSVDANIGFETNILLKSSFTIIGSFVVITLQNPLLIASIALASVLFYRI